MGRCCVDNQNLWDGQLDKGVVDILAQDSWENHRKEQQKLRSLLWKAFYKEEVKEGQSETTRSLSCSQVLKRP